MALLDHINGADDLRQLTPEQLPALAEELRESIIDLVAQQGGHLGASLGTVEITLALHYVLNTPHDRLIWDVGHQAYGHKLLTGRKEVFHTLRQWQGLSGFPKRQESPYDAFGTGHSSTSISALLGMAVADKLLQTQRNHVAVIGDAAMQAGMAFEALNHAGVADTDLLVVLNDNRMSIDPSVGALNAFLEQAASAYTQDTERIWRQLDGTDKSDANIFEDLHFSYFGPIDGHDLNVLVPVLERLVTKPGPKLLHILTRKGKGYAPAESGNATKWHAPGLFDKRTGTSSQQKPTHAPAKFQDVFGQTLVELAEQDTRIVGITPAMPTGSSLTFLMERFPERAFDVGIAEQHAVTFSAGLAAEGLVPYCVIYSTFLQRAYDQLIHDVAIQNLKVVFCLDRAGLVGQDGATHHGAYDLAFLRCIPGLTIVAPRNEVELRQWLYTAQTDAIQGPICIRYPRGRGFLDHWQVPFEARTPGTGTQLRSGKDIAIVGLGIPVEFAVRAAQQLQDEGIEAAVFDLQCLKPLDGQLLQEVWQRFDRVITVEDGCLKGGFGSAVQEEALRSGFTGKIRSLGIPDTVIEHGTPVELYAHCGIDADGIAQACREMLSRKASIS